MQEKKIMQIMKKNKVEFISAEFTVFLLSSPSRSISGKVRWYPSLALGTHFKTTRDHNLWPSPSGLAGPCCSARLAFYQHNTQGWFISHLTAPHVPPPPVYKGAFGTIKRVLSLDLPWEALFSFQERWWVCPPASAQVLVCPILLLFLIVYIVSDELAVIFM